MENRLKTVKNYEFDNYLYFVKIIVILISSSIYIM